MFRHAIDALQTHLRSLACCRSWESLTWRYKDLHRSWNGLAIVSGVPFSKLLFSHHAPSFSSLGQRAGVRHCIRGDHRANHWFEVPVAIERAGRVRCHRFGDCKRPLRFLDSINQARQEASDFFFTLRLRADSPGQRNCWRHHHPWWPYNGVSLVGRLCLPHRTYRTCKYNRQIE